MVSLPALKAPSWLARAWERLPLTRSGVIEPVIALMFLAAILSTPFPFLSEAPLAFALEIVICLAAGTVGRWPVGGVIVSGIATSALLLVPTKLLLLAPFAMFIPIISAGAQGRTLLRVVLTVWFWVVATLLDTGLPTTLDVFLKRASGYVFLLALAWLVASAIHSAGRAQHRLRAERADAVAAQRRSIARDLHDTVSYSTTSIILRAEQAKLRGADDPQLASDLDYIILAGRNSMRDLRGMMETLRRNEPSIDGVPHSPWRISSLQDILDARVAELRAHGFNATRHVEADLATLSESVKEALAKVIVESTSNMVKHGDPSAPCSILIEQGESDIEAVFINKPVASANADVGRLGLIGIRERVEALGGECEVVTTPTWMVRVRIPLEG